MSLTLYLTLGVVNFSYDKDPVDSKCTYYSSGISLLRKKYLRCRCRSVSCLN